MSNQFPAPDTRFLRVGAISGILGVVAALVQTATNPSYPDDPARAIEQASLSHALTLSRVLDLTAFLLLLIGISVVTTVFRVGRGAEWARLARTLFVVSAAAGAIATMVAGSFPDIAASWADAPAAVQPGYVAAYDALDHVTGGIFGVSWAALGFFGVVFGVALWRSDEFSHRLAGLSMASGVALLGAVVVGVGFQVQFAFVLLILGLVLSYAVVVMATVRVLRLAKARDHQVAPHVEPVVDPA
jgi:hypothetical protein